MADKTAGSGRAAMLMKLLSSYWLYAVLSLVLVIVFSLVQTSRTYRIEQGQPLATDTPRLVMHRVNVTQFAPDGSVTFTVNADGLAQFIDNRLSISNPLIVLFRDNQPTTFVRGARGDMRDTHLHLTGLVHVSTNEHTDLLTGETLDYYRDTNTMRVTNPRVTLRMDSSVSHITSRHLNTDLSSNKMQLTGGVVTRINEIVQ